MNTCTTFHIDVNAVAELADNISDTDQHYGCALYYLIANIRLDNAHGVSLLKELIKCIPKEHSAYMVALVRINAYTANDGSAPTMADSAPTMADSAPTMADSAPIMADSVSTVDVTAPAGYDLDTFKITDFNLFADNICKWHNNIDNVLKNNPDITFGQKYILGFMLRQYESIGLHSNKGSYRVTKSALAMLLDAPASIVKYAGYPVDVPNGIEGVMVDYYKQYITDKSKFDKVECMKHIIRNRDYFGNIILSYCRMHFTTIERIDMDDDLSAVPYTADALNYTK